MTTFNTILNDEFVTVKVLHYSPGTGRMITSASEEPNDPVGFECEVTGEDGKPVEVAPRDEAQLLEDYLNWEADQWD